MSLTEKEKPRSLALLSFDTEGAHRRVEEDIRDFPELQVTLAPSEAFEGNEGGEIVDIASNGNHTFVLRKDNEGKVRTVIYDEFNHKVEPGVYLPTSLKLGDFTQECVERNINSLHLSNLYSDRDNHYRNALDKIMPGISEEDVESIKEVLIDSSSDGQMFRVREILGNEELSNKNLISLEDARVKVSDSGDYFILQQGSKTAHIYEVRGRRGALPADKWVHTIVKKDETFQESVQSLPTDIQSEPVFFSDRSQHVEGTNLTAFFEETGVLSIVDRSKKQRLFSKGTKDYALDPSDNDTLYTIDTEESGVLRLIKASKISSRNWSPEIKKLKEIKGEPEEIRIDPQGNYVIVHSKKGYKGWLSVHEKDTLEKVWETDDIKGNLEVDEQGNIFYSDSQDKLRIAATTFTSFPAGTNFAQYRAEKLHRLRQRLDELTPEKVTEITETLVDKEEKVESEQTVYEIANNEIEAKLEELFGSEIKNADNLQALGIIRHQLEALGDQSEFKEYPSSFESLYNQISGRENLLKIDKLKELLSKSEQIEVDSFEDALSLWEHAREIVNIRAGVGIDDKKERGVINKAISKLTKQAEKYLAEHQEAFLVRIEEQFATVSELASSSHSEQELDMLRGQQEAMVLRGWVDKIPDADTRNELRDRFNQLFDAQSEQIKQRIQQTAEEKYIQIAESIEDIKSRLVDVSDIFSEVGSSQEFESLIRNNPQVLAIRGQILSLPDELRREKEQKLDDLIRAHRESLASRRRLGMVSAEKPDSVQFANESFPIYRLPPDFDRTKTREVPSFNPRWVMSEYYIEKLAEISAALKAQMANQESVLILEGESGTGKNVLLDMLAHYSNRELYNFASTGQTDKADLFYDHRYDPKKGTYQVISALVEGIERPGAIVNIDEISKLQERAVGLLNPLFDHRREISSPELELRRKVKPSVLLTATMNPRHYLGANQLPQDTLSRAVIIHLDYPPEVEGGKVRPDEPMIYSKYFQKLKEFNQEEFKAAWDYIINDDHGSGGDRFTTPEVEKEIKDIRMITKVANRVRAAREAFRTMQSFDSVELVFSIREGIQIANALRRYPNVKDAIKGVVLPKIADPEEKKRIELLINQT